MSINWDKVLDDQEKDPTAKPVPESDYDVRVAKAEPTTAGTGSPMIKLTVEVEHGPHAGRLVNTNLVFKTDSAGAMRMLIKRLAAFGITTEQLATDNPTVAQIAAMLVGRSAVASVNIRNWNDEDRNDVNMFKAKGAGAGVTAPPTIGEENGAPPVPPVPADSPATVPAAGPATEEEAF